MDILSPLQTLDDAIHEFLQTTDQLNGGHVTGWALGISTARLQTDDPDSLPMVSGMTYVFGPQTSVIQLAGLAKYLDLVAEKGMWQTLTPDDNDD